MKKNIFRICLVAVIAILIFSSVNAQANCVQNQYGGEYSGECVKFVRVNLGGSKTLMPGLCRYSQDCGAYNAWNHWDLGFGQGQTPKSGSILILDHWSGNPWGHMGIVTNVNGNTLTVNESNWDLDWKADCNVTYTFYPNERKVTRGNGTAKYPVKGFIYGSNTDDPSDDPVYPEGPSHQPIPGSRSDLRPDFDVYHVDGHEISSNCDDCATEPVEVGQRIRTNLEVQVENADVEDYLRDSDSKSIEGPIWWKIEGITDWQLLVSEEYDVDDLDDGDEPDEEEWFIVPDYSGEIIAFKACVDGDDEVWEEGEDDGDGEDIEDPDQSGTSNNCSRTERFLILEPNPEVVADPSSESGPVILALNFDNNIVDQSGNGLTVNEINNSMTYENGTAGVFQGDNYLSIPSSEVMNTDEISIVILVDELKSLPSADSKWIIRDGVRHSRIFQLAMKSDGRLYFYARTTDDSWGIQIITTRALIPGEKYRIVASFDQTNGANLWVNEGLWGSDTSFSGPLQHGTSSIEIGGTNHGDYFLNAGINNLTIYNHGLTEDEVLALAPGATANTVTIVPSVETVKPGNKFKVEVRIDGENIWAAHVDVTVAPDALEQTGKGGYGDFFNLSESFKIPIVYDAAAGAWRGALSLKHPAAPVSGEGVFARDLTYKAVYGKFGVTPITVTAALTDKDGNPLSCKTVNGEIFIDDGIHGGDTVIQGTVNYSDGTPAAGVPVTISIDGNEYTVKTDENGHYQFDELRDLSAGESYHIEAVLDGFVAEAEVTAEDISNSSGNNGSDNPTVDLPLQLLNTQLADLNKDGTINIADFTLLANAYDTVAGQSGFDERADINKDGKVNIADLAMLGSYWKI